MTLTIKPIGLLLLGWLTALYPTNAQPPLSLTAISEQGGYLPDYSWAGYHNSETPLPEQIGKTLLLTDFGAVADDGLDDSKALQAALREAQKTKESVTIQFPRGRLILSEIFYIERSNILLRGSGSGQGGTELYFPFPLDMLPAPPVLQELREYLVKYEKRQVEPENNVDVLFSQYAWSGGYFWTRVPGVRVKSYLAEYDTPMDILATIADGKQGTSTFTVKDAAKLETGQVVELQWYNKGGEEGSLLQAMYGNTPVTIGSHHWRNPDAALVRQRSRIIRIKGRQVTVADELIMDMESDWEPKVVAWEHLEEVGFAHFRMVFPPSNEFPHHKEAGFNAFFLTRLFNGWVDDVTIENSDSGILTEELANVTIRRVETTGTKQAHYTVTMGGVHNVLVEDLTIRNRARHPLSFNTYATKNVYTNCTVFQEPILDQHSGANHQNLFDNIDVHVSLGEDQTSYPLFVGGGAGYWKPSHGSYTTFWNINVQFSNGFDKDNPILLNGMEDGPNARLVGVHGNLPVKIAYGPDALIEKTNHRPAVPSLFSYQLKERLKKAN